MKNNERYVKLNSPKNKRYLVIIFAILALVGTLISSKYWLPDGRTDTSNYEIGKTYSFSSSELQIEKVAYSPSNIIGEVRVKEKISNYSNYKPLEFVIRDDSGKELPQKLIESDFVPNDKANKTGEKWSMIQFSIPNDYYYFSLKVNDEGYASRQINFDYRKVPQQELIEKADDYLKTAPALFKTIDKLNTDIEILNRYLKDIQPEITSAKNDVDVADDKTKEAKQSAYEKLLNEQSKYQQELETKESELKDYQSKLDEWEKQ